MAIDDGGGDGTGLGGGADEKRGSPEAMKLLQRERAARPEYSPNDGGGDETLQHRLTHARWDKEEGEKMTIQQG